MRILLANKFYYPRGGDCIYTLQLENLLKENGHEVAVFAMQHTENIDCEWTKYFPPEVKFVTDNKQISFAPLLRPFGTKDVKYKFNALLDSFNPDIVHLNNIHTQLSPVIAQLATQRNIKVVWTLHDYKLLCPRYDCLRNSEPCNLCYSNKINVIKHKCVKNSFIASVLGFLEAKKWNKNTLDSITDAFICPSQFIRNEMIKGGFENSKMHQIFNFIDLSKVSYESTERSDYCCYIGRFSEEKGIQTLLQAVSQTDVSIKLIGAGPLLEHLKEQYKDNPKIEFLGFQNWNEIREILLYSQFMIIPSEWYENNPISVVEALSLGTPVLGANIGGIPELIEPYKNGLLFESRNVSDLQQKIVQMFSITPTLDNDKIAECAQSRFSSENYYSKLIKIYEDIQM